jgi:hypothetical protein
MKRVDILKALRQDLAFRPDWKLPNTWWEEKVQAETGVNVRTIWYYIFHSGISTWSSAITQTHNHGDHGVLFYLLFPSLAVLQPTQPNESLWTSKSTTTTPIVLTASSLSLGLMKSCGNRCVIYSIMLSIVII